MRVIKALILTAVLSLSSMASGIGFKAQFVNDDIGPGFGAGFLGLIDVTDFFMFYPNIDFWYSSDSYHNRYWDHDHWVYYDRYSVYEIAFNVDAAFKFPVKPIQPYMGFGLAPVITVENWDNYYHDQYSDGGVGFNLFGGILFPMGTTTGMFEMRGKFGHYYNVFKLAFGMVFDVHTSSPRRRHY